MGRILDVNQVVQQLLDAGHPSSDEVRSCQDHLNSRYGALTSWGVSVVGLTGDPQPVVGCPCGVQVSNPGSKLDLDLLGVCLTRAGVVGPP